MKKIIFSLFLLVSFAAAEAQTLNGDRVIARNNFYLKNFWFTGVAKDSIDFNNSDWIPTGLGVKNYISSLNFGGGVVGTLGLVNDISSYSGNTKILHITDTLRGGTFIRYTGTDIVDNGMIFLDALSRKWIRQNADGVLNVQWYGCRSDDGTTNNRPLFMNALNYSRTHPKYREIYFPYDSTKTDAYNRYYMSDSILIDFQVKIKGDGAYKNPKSYIQFAAHKSGFVVRYPYGTNGFSFDMENIQLSVVDDWPNLDLTKNLITTSVLTHLKNINIIYGEGSGIYINACANPTTGDNNNYGDADLSSLDAVTASGCTNGLFIAGCDANVINITNCNFSTNRRWGVFDNGFLGNSYVSPHAAFNGVTAVRGGNSVVTYGGNYYAALYGHDGYMGDAFDSNYNKQPDISPAYWYKVTSMTANAWSATTRYYSGGAICIRNVNAWSTISAPYTEGFQPPINLNLRSWSNGGDNGALVRGGAWYNMFQGEQHIVNADMVIEPDADALVGRHLMLGTVSVDHAAVLSLKQLHSVTGSLNVISHGSDGLFAYDWYYNSASSAQVGLAVDNWQVNIDGNLITNTENSTGFTPGTTNTYNLGGVSLKWKDVYATTYHGDVQATASITTPKIISSGSVPTVTAGGSLGTGNSVFITTSSNNIAGNVTFSTGSASVGAGAQITVTFSSAYTVAPIVVLTATASQVDNTPYVISSTAGFTIYFRTAPAISTGFSYNYIAVQ